MDLKAKNNNKEKNKIRKRRYFPNWREKRKKKQNTWRFHFKYIFPHLMMAKLNKT